MGKRGVDFETVRNLGLALPETEAGTTYGSPALKVRGRMFACLASPRSTEPDTLVVCVGFDQRDELIAAEPATYYLKEHYVSHPVVLVRLAQVSPDAMGGLLRAAWQFVSATTSRRASARSSRPRPSRARSDKLR